MEYKLLEFKANGDERGYLTPIESGRDLPFEMKRIFYIYGTKGKDIIRGKHANRYSQFVLVMLAGYCKIDVYDTDGSYETIEMNSPTKGLFMKNMVWKQMYDFTDDAVLLCITDKYFDSTEYIDTYEEFLKEKNG